MEHVFERRDLTAVVDDLLEQARTSSSGRAALTVYGGRDHRLRQTLIAIRSGEELSDHPSPGEATLQVFRGVCVLRTAAERAELPAGTHVHIPDEMHAVEAIEDVVILLTTVVQAHRD